MYQLYLQHSTAEPLYETIEKGILTLLKHLRTNEQLNWEKLRILYDQQKWLLMSAGLSAAVLYMIYVEDDREIMYA